MDSHGVRQALLQVLPRPMRLDPLRRTIQQRSHSSQRWSSCSRAKTHTAREGAIGCPRSGDGPSLRAARRAGNARSTHVVTRCTQTLLWCRRPARVVREFRPLPNRQPERPPLPCPRAMVVRRQAPVRLRQATGSRRFSSGSSELSKHAGQIWTRGLGRVTVDPWNSR
jgi:hypothetical protein